MARPLRLEFAGALWHVTSRGNERKKIFRDDADRELFLTILEETVVRFGWRLLAWVLMPNHYHLAVETPEPTLSRGMHWLNGRYAQAFNRRYHRTGHLFQGRFHGVLVEGETYRLEVLRYIVLNPVRAGMVSVPERYKWTSFAATAGIKPAPPWLAAPDVWRWFAPDQQLAQRFYRTFVADGIRAPSPFDQRTGQIFLGSRTWILEIQKRIDEAPRSVEHPRAQLRIVRPTLDDVFQAVDTTVADANESRGCARKVGAFLAAEDALALQSEIATALGIRSRGRVSSLVSACRASLSHDPPLAKLVETCRARLKRNVPARGRHVIVPPFRQAATSA